MIYVCKGISDIIVKGKLDISELGDVNHEVIKSIFITITNANFDAEAIEKQILKMISIINRLKQNVSVTTRNHVW